jgi:hypothetical protein
MLEISLGSVKSIFKDNVDMQWIATKFMPHLLSEKQKENHMPGPSGEPRKRPRIPSEDDM